MLDKSSDQILKRKNFAHIQKEFDKNILNFVLCSESFHKVELLDGLVNISQVPVIVLDMDLLYTGYVESGMIKKSESVTIFNPSNKKNWNKELSEIITKILKNRFLVIIDSINGIYNIFEDNDSSRFINSCIMLLSSLTRNNKIPDDGPRSNVVITAIARKKESGEWILSPGGKQIVKLGKKMGIFSLKKIENEFVINSEKEDNQSKEMFR